MRHTDCRKERESALALSGIPQIPAHLSERMSATWLSDADHAEAQRIIREACAMFRQRYFDRRRDKVRQDSDLL